MAAAKDEKFVRLPREGGIKAHARSIFDVNTINRRLEVLASMQQTAEVETEIDYLQKLKARKFPNG